MMSCRYRPILTALAAAIAVMVAMVTMTVTLGTPMHAQTAQADAFQPPKTPRNYPNIGGLWNSSTGSRVEALGK